MYQQIILSSGTLFLLYSVYLYMFWPSKNVSESENYVDEEEDNEPVEHKLTECENISSSSDVSSQMDSFFEMLSDYGNM